MNEFDTLIESGLAECEEQIPATIKIGANTYAGNFSDLSMEESAMMGGIDSEATGIFILRKSLCPTKPADLSVVYVNGEKKKIAGVTDDRTAWNLGISE